MKTPTWAIVIGICMIVFGCFSVMKDVQSIMLPEMMEMQKEMMDNMSTTLEKNQQFESQKDSIQIQRQVKTFNHMSENMQKFYAMSPTLKKWIVRFGYIGLFFSTLYLLSGVFLLLRKSFSLQLVYIGLIAFILFSGTQLAFAAFTPSKGIMAKFFFMGNILSIIIDLVLVIVIASMDKTKYWNRDSM